MTTAGGLASVQGNQHSMELCHTSLIAGKEAKEAADSASWQECTACGTVDPANMMLIFDFDCTLTECMSILHHPPCDTLHMHANMFDCSCALPQVHMYKTLRDKDQQASIAHAFQAVTRSTASNCLQAQRTLDPDTFYDRIFGGAKRICHLQSFIHTLRQSVVRLRLFPVFARIFMRTITVVQLPQPCLVHLDVRYA